MDLIIPIITFVLGYFAEKILDAVLNKIAVKSKKKSIEHNIKQFHEDISNDIKDIIILANGNPYFTCKDLDISIENSKGLYIAFPEDYVSCLPESSGSFQTKNSTYASEIMEQNEEVSKEINKARLKIAEGFVHRTDGLYFNGMKYGVAYSDGFSRTCDDVEKPLLTLKLFPTDHFTHRVVSLACDNLNIPSSELTLNHLNHNLNWIRTSIGISIIVILKSTNQIIMTHRSANASFTEGKSWIYVSATETVTETDYDRYTQKIDFVLCIKRALLEELGITADKYSDDSIKFYDMFFERHFFQDGVVASIELNDKITLDDIKKLLSSAKDALLEVEDIFLLNNNKRNINNFIEKNKNEMRSQTIFSLRSYIARLH